MSSIHEKTLACLISRFLNNPAIVRLLNDDQFCKDCLRECGIIMTEKTNSVSVAVKAETAKKYQKYPQKALNTILQHDHVKTLKFRDTATGSIQCLYFVSGDNSEFLQPVFKNGYKITGKWFSPSEQDLEHLIGWIPFGMSCDWDKIEIKQQWLAKILKNAGTEKGIEARYNPTLGLVAEQLPIFIRKQTDQTDKAEQAEQAEQAE